PGLRGRTATLDHVLRDCRLSHLKAQFQQLAMNARRTPQGVRDAHLADQGTKFVVDPGPADTPARFPAPVAAKARAVPPEKRVRADDQHGSGDRRKQPIEPDEEKPIRVRELHAAAQLAPQYDDLLPERRVFRLKR